MERFNSLKYSLPDTRQTLRNRLKRYLGATRYQHAINKMAYETTDETTLQLLSSLEIVFRGNAIHVRETYEKASAQYTDLPSFDKLIEDAIIRVVWGRIYAGLEYRSALANYSANLKSVLPPILKERFGREFKVKGEIWKDASIAPVLEKLIKSPDEFLQFECISPDWVAARLWERMPRELNNPSDKLHYWADRWEIVGSPVFIPSRTWGTGAVSEFTSSVLEAIRNEKGILAWPQERLRMLKKAAHASNSPLSQIETGSPPVASTWIDRYLWLESREFQRVRDSFDSCEQIFGMVNILLQDVAHAENSGAPHPTAKYILELCNERPELLLFVTTIVHHNPILLADMLLYPPSSALACLLIADWTFPGSASDRELINRDNSSAQEEAFTDGISVAAHFLRTMRLPTGEIASLLAWLYGKKARPKYFNQNPPEQDRFIDIVRSAMVFQESRLLEGIVVNLSKRPDDFGLENPRFAAALDIVSAGGISSNITPDIFISPYLTSIRNSDYSLSAMSIDEQAAFILVKLAEKSDQWEQFLSPMDINALVKDAERSGDNKYIRLDSIARAIRTHVRILCRAASVWGGDIPEKMRKALVSYIHSGALDNLEKGRISAFAARYEQQLFNFGGDHPIAVDFSRVLYALSESSREPILDAILEIDEPLTLAQLLPISPPLIGKKISDRISSLSPMEAAEVHTLPELQARINELLSAGAFDAAEKFMELERELRTLGKVKGRETARLQADLRIKLYREDHDAISKTELPPGLDKNEEEEASNVLNFYKALSQHSRPDGDLKSAEATFATLSKRAPYVITYSLNLLAVRVSALLTGDLFKRLQGPEQMRARDAIKDADAAFAQARGVTAEDRATHFCNRALLLLAIGQPEVAFETLNSIPESRLQERVEAYSAIALFRMGRGPKAIETIDRAITIFGNSEILHAARMQITRGVPLDARATASTYDDVVRPITEALFKFSKLDPQVQAQVLQATPDAFDEFTISQLRAAMSSVVVLVPFFKKTKGNRFEENHITRVIREFVTSRLNFFLGWSFQCQPKGGYSANGNPGEPDLIIEKDGATLAAVEAVVCSRPISTDWTKNELLSHFQKLFGYSTCRLFFHLSYVFISDIPGIRKELHHIAETKAPKDFQFVQISEIPLTNSMPTGFTAQYRSSTGLVKVAFLILDLVQQIQRDAAKLAQKSNPRGKKIKKKKKEIKKKKK